MLRFYYLIICFIPVIIYYVLLADYYCSHEEEYDEVKRYSLAIRIMESLKRNKKCRIYAACGVSQTPKLRIVSAL